MKEFLLQSRQEPARYVPGPPFSSPDLAVCAVRACQACPVTPYQPAEWHDLFVAMAGASAALTGAVFNVWILLVEIQR